MPNIRNTFKVNQCKLNWNRLTRVSNEHFFLSLTREKQRDEHFFLSSASPRTNEDRFIPDSPTLDMGLLISGNETKYETRSNQSSPSARSLSNGVAPFTFDGESLPSFHFQPEVNPMIDENLIKTTWADDLASIDALMNEF